MQIVTGKNIYNKIIDASVVTIGNFDGVHLGHAGIFTHLTKKSAELLLPSAVVTFEPHPLKVLSPKTAPPLLTTLEQKIELIREYGIDYLVIVPFSKDFSQLSAADFVVRILSAPLGMRHIIIGHDYAFGRGREGNFSTLTILGKVNGFTLEDMPALGENEVIFSSSLVRSKVAEGNLTEAAHILGRYFQITGTVVHGRDIGHSLGFPTANIVTENELLPPDGVYAVMAQVDGQLVKGACNIGCNPTFGSTARTVEVFLLDFSDTVYDHKISLQFIKRLRAEQKFASASELKTAIAGDVTATRIALENLNNKYVRPEHHVN